MPDRPAAPIVTITDPARPAPLSDVIGEDRPERFTGRQKLLAWVAVGVVALGAAGVWGLQQLAEQRRLDRAAVSELSLSLLGNDTIGTGKADVDIVNQGPHEVTVLSVGLDLPHLAPLRTTSTRLAPTVPSTIPVSLPTSCPAGTAGAPQHLLLRVRTHRGNEATVKVNVTQGNGFISNVVYAALAPCARPQVEASLIYVSTGTDELQLNLALRSLGPVPVQVTEPQFTGGPESGGIVIGDLADSLPLNLESGDARVVVSTYLFVDSCDLAKTTWTATATGGVPVKVTGAPDAKPVVVPFNDPHIRRFVQSYCARVRSAPVFPGNGGFGGAITGPGITNGPVTVTGTTAGPLTVTMTSPSPSP